MDIIVTFPPIGMSDVADIRILKEQELDPEEIAVPGEDTLLYVVPDFSVESFVMSVRLEGDLNPSAIDSFENVREHDLRVVCNPADPVDFKSGFARKAWKQPLIGRATGLRILW